MGPQGAYHDMESWLRNNYSMFRFYGIPIHSPGPVLGPGVTKSWVLSTVCEGNRGCDKHTSHEQRIGFPRVEG